MIITLLESKFLSAIPLELLSPGRSGNAQTSDNIICISSSLTLLSFVFHSLEKVYLCRGAR